MAIAAGDVLQITDVQQFLGQETLNVYFYEVESVGSGATYQQVADQFQTDVISVIRAAQSDDLSHVRTITKNLTNGLDIFEDVVAANGTDGNENLNSFTSLGFRLVRSTALTRHGAKRIGGLTEALVSGNDLTAPGLTVAADIEDVLAAPVEITSGGGSGFVMNPVIVGRFPAGDPNAGELDLSKLNPVSSAQFIRVTTQNTRKAGRGS